MNRLWGHGAWSCAGAEVAAATGGVGAGVGRGAGVDAGVAWQERVWVWLSVQAGVPTEAKDSEGVVDEEDTVVEWNGLEGSACWIAEGGCEMRGAVWEGKGL